MADRASHELLVIGIGFGRTGTKSLQNLLNDVGLGPCYHGFIKFFSENDNEFWWEIANMSIEERKNVNWNGFFYEYQNNGKIYNSTVDWPAAQCWQEICEFYPKSKVILSVRDSNKWYKSLTKALYPHFGIFSYPYLHYLINKKHNREWNVNDKLYMKQFGGLFNAHKPKNKENIIKLFEDRNNQITKYFDDEKTSKKLQKSRLFVYDLERVDKNNQKIELLKFLDVDINKYRNIKMTGSNTTKHILDKLYDYCRSECLKYATIVAWTISVGFIVVKRNV